MVQISVEKLRILADAVSIGKERTAWARALPPDGNFGELARDRL